MNLLPPKIKASPVLVRVVPFVIFLVLTSAQSYFGEAGKYWLYPGKTLAGAWMLWEVREFIPELRWKLSWEAIAVGVAVFALWIKLDEVLVAFGWENSYPKPKLTGGAWNPFEQFAGNAALAWGFVVVRIAGSSLIVPPLEEVFFRSFVYRYLKSPDFRSVPLGAFYWMPFLVTAAIFGAEHREWLAGIFCGFAYQGLVIWKRRLGDAITAHAITNGCLGAWVVWKGQWQFW